MMDNQKLFLIIAIALSIFLLWNQWEVAHTVDANGKSIRQTKLVEPSQVAPPSTTTAENPDVPSVSVSATSAVDLPAPKTTAKTPFTTVVTDFLTVEISHTGGNIQNAWLNDYPLKKGSASKFQLLSNQTEQLFQAQSGLASKDNLLPTHLSTGFKSAQSHYQLNGDTLVVPLIWQTGNGVQVVKNFYFAKGSHNIDVNYQITNNSTQTIPVKSYVRLTRNALDQSNLLVPTFTGGLIYDKTTNSVQKNEFTDWSDFSPQQSLGGWMAMAQQYFIAAWVPEQNQNQVFSASVHENLYKLTDANPQIDLAPGEQITLAANRLYLGPKEYGKIEKISPGLNYTLDYGWLDVLADPLSWTIHRINDFVSSWGWSIIIITILIKLIFYPLSEKSYRSMASMRKLAPRLTKLKQIYGDDRQKMGQKTMELYKKEKVNPAAGCLPILVQIPVFIAFYWMLLDTVELRQTAFWWLDDLSAKDPYYILPIIMGVSMFIQQKLNPPPPDPMQAKIMMSLPFVFTVFFLWFPSGLVLYWVFNNVLSIAQQWAINKRMNG